MKGVCVLIVGLSILFTSCRKEYSCVCRYKGFESITSFNETKKKAQNACEGLGYQYRNNGANVTCTIE